jgi:hypothetical protein
VATDFEPVTLLDPSGNEYVAASPTEVNDLMYGHGYKPKGKQTVEETSAAAGGLSAPSRSAKSSKDKADEQ